jgi:hypothetical protein
MCKNEIQERGVKVTVRNTIKIFHRDCFIKSLGFKEDGIIHVEDI